MNQIRNTTTTLIIVSFIVLLSFNANSQQLTRHVISCIGNSKTQNGVYFSQSVGQPLGFKQHYRNDNILNVGFQQSLLDFKNEAGDNSNFVFVWPNPSNGTFFFQLETNYNNSVHSKIYDSLGKLVYENKATQVTGGVAFISHSLSSGLYFLQIGFENNSASTSTLIIQ
jgi:hypothetical protein